MFYKVALARIGTLRSGALCVPGAGFGRGCLLRCGLSFTTDCHGLLLAQDGQEDAFEKWRVENSWGEDRGNKGNLQS